MSTTTQTLPSPQATSQENQPRASGLPQLITAMLRSGGQISDLIFSPGRAPQVEKGGQLVELKFKGLEYLKPRTRARSPMS